MHCASPTHKEYFWRTTLIYGGLFSPSSENPRISVVLQARAPAGLSAINPGIMADYFLQTPENTGNFNVFAPGGVQTYLRNYGVVLRTTILMDNDDRCDDNTDLSTLPMGYQLCPTRIHFGISSAGCAPGKRQRRWNWCSTTRAETRGESDFFPEANKRIWINAPDRK